MLNRLMYFWPSVEILFFKGMAMLMSFYSIKLISERLSSEQLGLWLTILSVTSWLSLSDAGITNALRNKLSQSLARGELLKAKELVSSSYFYFFCFLSLLMFVFFVGGSFVDLNFIFNVDWSENLDSTVAFAICAVVVNVYFLLNSAVFFALDKASFDAKRTFLFQFLFVVFCYILSGDIFYYNSSDALLYCSFFYFLSAVISNIIGYFYLYKSESKLRPNFSDCSYSVFKSLYGVGIKFLLLQISAVLLYSTDAFLIAHLFDISSVTYFNLTNKIFFIFIFVQGALLSPMWSRYTFFYEQGEKGKLIKQLYISFSISFALVLLMTGIISYIGDILNFWLDTEMEMQKEVIFGVFLLTTTRIWCSNFSTLLNGLGDLKAQLYSSFFAIFINVPLSIILVKWYDFGVEGVAYGSVMALLLFAIIGPVRAYKCILNITNVKS
ncbi:TPA: lipopolysaccharide biosynthesis protein [Vibrio fluvialis]|nr:hypothetical protein [Vibrio fluvialis]EKO3996549.1 hypothetical protein [Vibrio fluvialis]